MAVFVVTTAIGISSRINDSIVVTVNIEELHLSTVMKSAIHMFFLQPIRYCNNQLNSCSELGKNRELA